MDSFSQCVTDQLCWFALQLGAFGALLLGFGAVAITASTFALRRQQFNRQRRLDAGAIPQPILEEKADSHRAPAAPGQAEVRDVA